MAFVDIGKTIAQVVVDLTPSDRMERGTELAHCARDLDRLADEKKRVAGELKMRQSDLEGRQRTLARAIETGKEERPMDCRKLVNPASPGTVRIVRCDDGDLVQERQMTSSEWQDFESKRQQVLDLAADDEQRQ